jgi:O-antigen/teichoic acid export membrane protein
LDAQAGSETPGIADSALLGSALRGGAVYAGAAAFQRGIVFLLLPIYTRVLDPSAFGRLSVLLAIATAAVILLSIGMDTAFFRSYFALRDDPERQRRFVTTAWVFLLLGAPAGATVLALAARPFLAHSDTVPFGELALALIGSALFVSATVVPLALLRAEERLRDYMVFTVVIAGTTAAFTFVAVVVIEGGVGGWFGAVIAANTVTLLVAVRLVPLRLANGIDRRLLVGALALGAPLIPHMLSHWGLSVSNRLVLAGIVPTFQVGVFALATTLALPVAILMQGMAQGFMPAYARAAVDSAALNALPRLINVQYLLVLTLTTAATLFGPIAARYVAPSEYAAAAALVPWMTAGYGLLGLYFLPMNAMTLTEGRTGKVWMITVIAVGANFAALFTLVPSLGLTGAAIASMLGYAVLLLGVGIYSRGPDNPVRYQRARLTRAALVFIAMYVGAVVSSGDRTVLDAFIRLGWLAAVLPFLVLAKVVDRSQIATMARLLRPRHRPISSA